MGAFPVELPYLTGSEEIVMVGSEDVLSGSYAGGSILD